LRSHQTIARDEYFALLSVADLALITALRDGMNTTSMEFAICQDKTSKAPIVLSEFMGTASSFGSALLINPHDVLGVAAAINQGLTMSQEEKERRHAEVYEQVTSHSSGCWAASVLKVLLENIGGEHSAHETPFVDKTVMKEKYDAAKKRLMLFDYDGTLTPIVKVPSEATPTPRTLAAISKLAEDPRNIVYLISGRDGDFLDEHWGHVKSLGLSAEHGCFLRPPGGEGWKGLTEKLDMSWMSEVQEIFQYYTEVRLVSASLTVCALADVLSCLLARSARRAATSSSRRPRSLGTTASRIPTSARSSASSATTCLRALSPPVGR
jgi:trehalose 6-phosphate synthase/phosphatase